MTKPASTVRRPKLHRDDPRRGIPEPADAGRATTDRTTFREDFQLDHGPDLDEPLDGTESGRGY
jgi:hypothetical protein